MQASERKDHMELKMRKLICEGDDTVVVVMYQLVTVPTSVTVPPPSVACRPTALTVSLPKAERPSPTNAKTPCATLIMSIEMGIISANLMGGEGEQRRRWWHESKMYKSSGANKGHGGTNDTGQKDTKKRQEQREGVETREVIARNEEWRRVKAGRSTRPLVSSILC
jgi:hypothetical protein